jgi:hypothetical protein
MPDKASGEVKLPFPPYNKFVDFLNDLGGMGVLPNRLNQQVFATSYSGSSKWQILRALRFFDLTSDDGAPNTERLQPLFDPKTRQAALNALLQERYKNLIDLPLASAGPQEVNTWFTNQGLDAATTRKAKSFFLAAAAENGIAVHELVASKKGGGRPVGAGSRRKNRKAGKKDEPTTPTLPATPHVAHSHDGVLFHPAIDIFLREARKLTERDAWNDKAREQVIQGFTTQLDLFLPVKAKARVARAENEKKEAQDAT